ncbi:hypothetical protein GIB67_010824 [Kingdonia uniflora]|uniref:Uncharacterized protein n=1 Tax=Kingdonia uniflora TaxID=39325 RepID=A0A7J7L981_9MAGN|nr:hypothetical protein GIB67_010824 [Kingdonia uniflora]
MQWDPFRNMKDALKREVIIADNTSRKRVLLQSPFGGYEWYLGDHCWVQLEHRVVPYDPQEKLYCFPSLDAVRSLRAVGWIEAQHYIVGYHIDYDAYWRHVLHDALMSDIARCGNIDIPGLGDLTARVTFLHVEFPPGDFSTHEIQIPPPRLGGCSRCGKMTKVKRELLKWGLLGRGVQEGRVHGEGHLKVGPLFPNDQDVRENLLSK